MDSDSIRRIIVLLLLIMMSGFFSATETAYSAMNRIRLKNLASEGNATAERTLRISEDFDRLLSTVLIGNNIVNIVATTVAAMLFLKLWPDTGATISTIVMTVTVLIFGEVSPKSLAKEDPERFAMAVSRPIRILEVLLFPLTWFFSQWKKLLSIIFRTGEDRGITEEELLTIVEEAESSGDLDEQESDLIRSAIEFNDLECSDILTPRVELESIEKKEELSKILKTFTESAYSRLPVYEEDLDNIVGVLNYKDFYAKVLVLNQPIESAISEVIRVSPDTKISKLLKLLQQNKLHMAVVIDEYGGTVGIVTMEDILEELVGEIWDEHDEVIQEIVKLPDGSIRVLCSMELSTLQEVLDFEEEEEDYDATTVSGWIMGNLGRIPEQGDRFQSGKYEVTVTKTDERKPIEAIFTPLQKEEENQTE